MESSGGGRSSCSPRRTSQAFSELSPPFGEARTLLGSVRSLRLGRAAGMGRGLVVPLPSNVSEWFNSGNERVSLRSSLFSVRMFYYISKWFLSSSLCWEQEGFSPVRTVSAWKRGGPLRTGRPSSHCH